MINVSKSYLSNQEKVEAVKEINLKIENNEIFGIVGESGAGKSTLLRFINLLEKPDEGQVLVDGVNLLSLSRQQLNLQRKSMSMIFQHFNLLNNKTVADNILLPLALHDYRDTMDLDEVLEFVGLKAHKYHYPSQLSGGQKQRVGIARALITKPKVLLCDEPTSALDVMRTSEIIQLLQRAHHELEMTIVLVTHELDLIRRLCHRVAVVDQGQLIDIVENHVLHSEDYPNSYYESVLEVLRND